MGAGKPLCILVADDDEDSLTSLARLLEINGHTVYTARTAAEAKDLAAAKRCDLFLGDLGLLDQSGLDLIRVQERHGLKGIAVSGYAASQDVDEALRPDSRSTSPSPLSSTSCLPRSTN